MTSSDDAEMERKVFVSQQTEGGMSRADELLRRVCETWKPGTPYHEYQEAVEAARAYLAAEPAPPTDCESCGGSGEAVIFHNGGPYGQREVIKCRDCKGTGLADTTLAGIYEPLTDAETLAAREATREANAGVECAHGDNTEPAPPCPYIVSSDDGTSYCRLAEQNGPAPSEKQGEERIRELSDEIAVIGCREDTWAQVLVAIERALRTYGDERAKAERERIPREPTQEMVEEAINANREMPTCLLLYETEIRALWTAMYDAAIRGDKR